MTEISDFYDERADRINSYQQNTKLNQLSLNWAELSMRNKYVYNFDWLGRPIIQFPHDIVAIQEIIWDVKPDLIIETGIAHGGSLILSASILALLEISDVSKGGGFLDPKKPSRKVIGIDVDIRLHNRELIESHALANWIVMIEDSSTSEETFKKVSNLTSSFKRIMIFLDSNHTYDHVRKELEFYSKFVAVGSYLVVFDTFIEDVPEDVFDSRPWSHGNSPKTAVWDFLKDHPEFEIDKNIQNKLQVTVSPDGYLRRIN